MSCNGNNHILCDNNDCDKCFQRSLMSHPRAVYFSVKNNISSRKVFKSSGKKYYFDCSCGYTEQIKVCEFVRNNFCPHCENVRKLCKDEHCKICFSRSMISHEKSKYWSSKNIISPRDVFKNSNQKYWFDCECGHSFESQPSSIVSGNNWCPYCCLPIRKLCDDEKCLRCFNNSFQSCSKSSYWSKKNILSPRQIIKNTHEKYWFNCSCEHEFCMALSHVVKGQWCSYCCIPSQKLCEDTKCLHCTNNSFQSCSKSSYWSKKNILSPRQVIKNTHEKYWFDCSCGHEFCMGLNSIVQGQWCPYCCVSPKKLCNNESCRQCFEKSYAVNIYSTSFWSDKNILKPREVFKNAREKYWFNCKNGHEFQSSPSNHTGCPKCYFKTEGKLSQWLEENKYLFSNQASFQWCKKINRSRYDFLIKNLKIIIELDGPQHHKQISNWTSPEENHKNDLFKTGKALENGYSIIRILQEDVFDDKNDWKNKLKKYLHEYDKLTCIFINNNNEYDKLNKEMENIREIKKCNFEIIYDNNI